MRLFDRSKAQENMDNPLTEALFEYRCSLERGNYSTLNSYDQADFGWTNADEIEAIEFLLKPLLGELNIEDINCQTLNQALKKDNSITFAKIAHLSFSLELLKKQKVVNSEGELDSLKEIGILTRVEAAMPIACIAYLGALRHSSLHNNIKLPLINSVIITISDKRDDFGVLGELALRTAVNDWIQTAEKSGCDKYKRAKIAKLLSEYRDITSFDSVRSQLSLVDKYMLLICNKLKNNIGDIYKGEFTSTEPRLSAQANLEVSH